MGQIVTYPLILKTYGFRRRPQFSVGWGGAAQIGSAKYLHFICLFRYVVFIPQRALSSAGPRWDGLCGCLAATTDISDLEVLKF